MPSRKKSETTVLRIIGGALRGRKLMIPVCEGLRPTHDRIRETLFNWLQPIVIGSHCLDAFAGSGALGFEAVSRGAASAVFVENDAEQAAALLENAETLKIKNKVEVLQGGWPKQKLPADKFNLVFLDPPFGKGWIEVVWERLLSQTCLTDQCWVYVEHGIEEKPSIPDGFSCYRAKQTKQVAYSLWYRA
jgi:16S rRNA (guanine966-N2)-methyltransferase